MIRFRTVTFRYLDSDGDPLAGTIKFTPTVLLVDAPTDVFFTTAETTVTLDASGYGSALLACTDNLELTPNGWTWAVQEFVPEGRNRDNAFFVLLPYGDGSDIGLTDLAGATPSAYSWAPGGTVVGDSLHDTWYGAALPTNGERVPPYLWAPPSGGLYLVEDDPGGGGVTTIYPSDTRYPSDTTYPSGGSTVIYPSNTRYPSTTLYPGG